MTFSESAAIEALRGLFTLLAVAIGGGVVGRAIERFKGEQAVSMELRRRQYDTLGAMLSALAQLETAFTERHNAMASRDEDDEGEADAAHERFLEAHRDALHAIDAAVYVLGADVTNHAVDIANFFVERADAPQRSLDDVFAELRPLRAPLTALLPPPLPGIPRPAAASPARAASPRGRPSAA
jgi:hypothetical protein